MIKSHPYILQFTLSAVLSMIAFGCTLETVPDCIHGTTKCEKGILSLCGENGKWILQGDCDMPACSPEDKDKEVCQPIDDHNYIIFACHRNNDANYYWIPEVCDSCDPKTRKCNNTETDNSCTSKCVSIDIASTNQMYNILLWCDDDKYVSKYCPSGSICDESRSECIVCDENNNETKCINELSSQIGYKYTCSNGQLTELEDGKCENNVSCMDTKTCGHCLNGSQKCEIGTNNTGIIKQCENGDWKEHGNCDNNVSCKDDTNCGECHNTDVRYNDDNSVKCTDVFDEAKNDKVGKIESCNNGQWRTINCRNDIDVSCTAQQTCGECLNGDVKNDCLNGEISGCVEGEWRKIKCKNGSCTSEHTCGECETGTSKNCSSIKIDSEVTPDGEAFICNDGKWSEAKEHCKNGLSNVSCDGDACGECLDGDTKECSDGYAIFCKNGKWANTKEECPDHVLCNEDHKCDICITGNTKDCIDGVARRCKNGKWSEPEKCGIDKEVSCTSDNKCGECRDDDIKDCKDGVYSICKDGEWLHNQECTYNNKPVSCTNNYSCGVCHNGDVRNCQEQVGASPKAEFCIDGKWIEQKCPKSTCKPDGSCGECNSNDTIDCELDSSGYWSAYKCLNGTISAEKHKCNNNYSCTSYINSNGQTESICGECMNSDSNGCIGKKTLASPCTNGRHEKYITCGEGKTVGYPECRSTQCCKYQAGNYICYEGDPFAD